MHDPIDRAMAETISRVGHIMGLQTVGEYAESDSVIAELCNLGVDIAQGYVVQRPQAAARRPKHSPEQCNLCWRPHFTVCFDSTHSTG